MSDPLNPQVEGDLSALGISDRNPISVEEPTPVEEAQATAAEEPQEEVPVQAEPEPAEDEPKSVLAQLDEQEAAPVEESSLQAELDRERQARASAEAALRERRRIAEEEIRTAAPTPEPAKEEPESYLNSPYVQQTLQAVRENHPEQYEQTLIEIAKAEFAKEVEAKEMALRAELDKVRQESQQREANASAEQGIKSAFSKIKAESGLGAELVDELYSKGYDDSHLGRMMAAEPGRFQTERGTEEAIRILESRLNAKIRQAQQREPTAAVQGAVVSAGTGVASTRGIAMNEKPKEVSPEDDYADRMFNTSRANKIEFLG